MRGAMIFCNEITGLAFMLGAWFKADTMPVGTFRGLVLLGIGIILTNFAALYVNK